MAEGGFLSQPATDINAIVQALSALLQPQGKMLQVAPITPETKDETAEAMSSGGSDELETEGKPDKPTEHIADLPAVALQQIVVQSGVIRAVLQAVRQAGNRPSTGSTRQTLCHCLCALPTMIAARMSCHVAILRNIMHDTCDILVSICKISYKHRIYLYIDAIYSKAP